MYPQIKPAESQVFLLTNDYQQILSNMRSFQQKNRPIPLDLRRKALKNLYKAIKNHENDINQALWLDLHKSSAESYLTETGIILSEIRYHLKHLAKWSKPQKTSAPLSLFGTKSYIYPESYGVVLIISPWNYPFQLTFMPLIAAISGGNCAVLKPSPLAMHSAKVIDTIIRESFDENMACVFLGENALTNELLQEKFDYIFYTGGPSYGKTVMEYAAKNLTPLTLELGGKSPCIVLADADLKLAAKKIIFGKFLNNGQTCVAPDYVLVARAQKETLISELVLALKEQYPTYDKLATIISENHLQRLISLLDGEKIVIGGHYDLAKHFLEPTIIDEVTFASPIMQAEIFGGILPIIAYDDLDSTLNTLKSMPKALAAYIFTTDQNKAEKIIGELSFGGGCINDTILHLVNNRLPFGGVGNSGMGAYHGKSGFDTFTHYKSVLNRSKIDLPLLYPPYTSRALRLIKHFLH